MNPDIFLEEHRLFRDTVGKFIRKEVIPHVPDWEERGEIPRNIFERMGELGFLGLNYPIEYGGSGADVFSTIVFVEELTKSGCLGFVNSVLVDVDMASHHIHAFGTAEQKKKYLEPIISGKSICAIGVTEPDHGSDVAALSTTAKNNGDHYVVNGSKTFITNGVTADLIVLAVRTDPDRTKKHKGISLILFETKTPGFKVGRKLKKMGMRSSDTGELYFDNCIVPCENLLGSENKGFYQIMEGFDLERLIVATFCVEAANLALQEAIKYAGQRIQFDKKLHEFQVIRHKIAEMATEIELTRNMVYQCARLYNSKRPCLKEITMLKHYSTRMAQRVVDEALQIHGGYGYMEEYLVERLYRDLRLFTIAGGTKEVMLEIVARLIINN
jgi:alkylation response protein AidB-like acyl-CoA dehydrogenase